MNRESMSGGGGGGSNISGSISSSAIQSNNTNTADLYEYETHVPDNESQQFHERLPPERLARKHRHYDRRGGYVHSYLLKGAVLASMASIDEEPNHPDGMRRPVPPVRSDSSCLQAMQDALFMDGNNSSGHAPTTPRKRVRRSTSRRSQDYLLQGGSGHGSSHAALATHGEGSSMTDSNHSAHCRADSAAIEDPLSELFGVLSMPSEDTQESQDGRAAPCMRRPPMRRVSRRRSYNDRVKKEDVCVEEQEVEEESDSEQETEGTDIGS